MLHDDELTPAERSQFASLAWEHVGSADLEDRVVRALRDRGLLEDESPRMRAPRWWRGVASVAAGFVVFGTGVLVGQRVHPAGQPAVAAKSADSLDAMELSQAVQRVGSEYVALLAKVPASDTMTMPLEVARSTLLAAARQVARRAPNEVISASIIRAIPIGGGAGGTRSSSAMIVF